MLLLPYGWPCAFIYRGSVVQQTWEKKIGIIFSPYNWWNKDMQQKKKTAIQRRKTFSKKTLEHAKK